MATPQPQPVPTGQTEAFAVYRHQDCAPGLDRHVRGEREERAGDDRLATRSRRSGSEPATCHATAAAELTSMTGPSPNPISATDEAIVPAARATTASTTL